MENTFNKLLNELERAERHTRALVLQRIENRLSDLYQPESSYAQLSIAEMARVILFFGMSFSEGQKSASNAVKWAQLERLLSDKWIAFPEFLRTAVPRLDSETIKTFATLGNLRRGPNEKSCLLTLALFIMLMDQEDQWKRDFLLRILTKEERNLPARLISVFRNELRSGHTEAYEPTNDDVVKFSFEIAREKQQHLHDFVEPFRHGDDNCAHLILYRPSKSNPYKFIKSFMAISPPDRAPIASNSYVFTHIYTPPRGLGGASRVSIGRLLPLNEGLYFVGGQKTDTKSSTNRSARTPYDTLKVIGMHWGEVQQYVFYLPALAMSANYGKKLIASRMFIKKTPISHSKDLKLGLIKISDLQKDIKDDLNTEFNQFQNSLAHEDKRSIEKLMSKWECFGPWYSQTHELCAEKVSQTISDRLLEVATNAPQSSDAWGVQPGFEISKGNRKSAKLDNVELQSIINQSLADKGASFKREGPDFKFPSDLLFSALDLD